MMHLIHIYGQLPSQTQIPLMKIPHLLYQIHSGDVLLDVTSSTECSIEPESVSDMVTVGGGIGFTTDFDGVLCNGQSITLENNSVQQSGFQWDIEGATIISDQVLKMQ